MTNPAESRARIAAEAVAASAAAKAAQSAQTAQAAANTQAGEDAAARTAALPQPGGRPGAASSGQPGVTPNGASGSQPGGRPGVTPSGQPGITPNSQPGSRSGVTSGSQPGGGPSAQSRTRPALSDDPAVLQAGIVAATRSLSTHLEELSSRVNPAKSIARLRRVAKITAVVGTVVFTLVAVRRRSRKRNR